MLKGLSKSCLGFSCKPVIHDYLVISTHHHYLYFAYYECLKKKLYTQIYFLKLRARITDFVIISAMTCAAIFTKKVFPDKVGIEYFYGLYSCEMFLFCIKFLSNKSGYINQ